VIDGERFVGAVLQRANEEKGSPPRRSAIRQPQYLCLNPSIEDMHGHRDGTLARFGSAVKMKHDDLVALSSLLRSHGKPLGFAFADAERSIRNSNGFAWW
jgi:hypothetical protein